MQLMTNGMWVGGDETNIVATDAKNGTPISAVAYAMDDVSTVCLLCSVSHAYILTGDSGTYFTSTLTTSSARRLATTRRTSGQTAQSEL